MVRARVTLTLFLVIPAAFAWACGGDDTNDAGTDSGGNDGTVGNDTGPGKDGSSNDSSSNDSSTNDTGTNDTGANDTGTTDGGTTDGGTTDGGGLDASSFTCTKPSDCTNQFCCGTIIFNGGTLPNCTLEDASSKCASTCVSNIALACKATDTVRACAVNNDCLDAGSLYNKCCTVSFSDASVDICWNATYAGLVGGSCQ